MARRTVAMALGGGIVALCLCAALLGVGWWTQRPPTLARVQGQIFLDKPAPAPLLNRIAVLGDDGNITLLAPDGSDPVRLTTDASPRQVYRYPTWSPNGATLAFVELSLTTDDETESALHFMSPRGGASHRVPTELPAFYLFWSPTSERLAFLSNWADSMALRMVNVAAGATEATTVSEGMPFFFSWEPTGRSLLAHIGSDLLTFLDEQGRQVPLDIPAGLFQAPHWSADGQQLAFVSASASGESVLHVSDAKGETLRELARQEGVFALNWSPDNQRIAYSYTQEQLGLAAFGPLRVRDATSDEEWQLSEDPVVAFFWSPDGKRLAYLRPERHAPVERGPVAAPLHQDSEIWFRWYIWDGAHSYPLALFSPSEEFLLDYLRFFDQYAQSISLWSPDSQHLLYAGTSERGLSGIWILPTDEGSTPRRLTDGTLAAWSPR